MSAKINSLSIQQVKPNSTIHESPSTSAVSDISVITRIDYNLRFAKQAVLVVSEATEQYSKLSSQYLVSLSNVSEANDDNQVNVAYLSASSKLNDLQIRCRLVEQLFVNSLFDPEQSLAVSVIQFAKQQGNAISIVIEHAQTLSLQIKYELSQLVNQSQKHNITVNVVLFGLFDAAQQLAVNKTLFKNKMALIDAGTGQIINLGDAKIQPKRLKQKLSNTKKIGLATLVVIVAVSCFWAYKLISDDIKQQNLLTIANNTATVLPLNNTHNLPLSSDSVEAKSTEENVAKLPVKLEASGQEINAAILAKPFDKASKIKAADSSEILNALTAPLSSQQALKSQQSLVKEANTVEKNFKKVSDMAAIRKTRVDQIDSNYYHNQAVVHEQGYIIQIAGFNDQRLWARFMTSNQNQTLFSYQRMLNKDKFFVVTSQVFANKEEAQQALAQLPKYLLDRKPWIKDISSVINEINTFKR